jgi:CIC family chloride channel protein
MGRVRLSLPRAIGKSIASFAAIGSGGSIGREGPIIQLGGALGAAIGRRLRLSGTRIRALVAAGAGAGFAAAYNTPLAAVLFVVEIVTGVAALEAVLPTVIAIALTTAVTRGLVGGGPIYGLRAFELASTTELVAHAILGLVAALVAHAFVVLLATSERAFDSSGVPQPLRAGLGGAIVGVVALAVPEVAGNGYEPLGALLDGRFGLALVAALVVAKAVATSASVGSGSPGGVFTPTLLLGASVGLVFGQLVAQIVGPGHVGPAGGYALVGMAATSAATTHAPLMAAVLVFELSGDYAIVLPLMLATGVSTTLARRLRPTSIYAAELGRRGVSWQVTLEGRTITDDPTQPSDPAERDHR